MAFLSRRVRLTRLALRTGARESEPRTPVTGQIHFFTFLSFLGTGLFRFHHIDSSPCQKCARAKKGTATNFRFSNPFKNQRFVERKFVAVPFFASSDFRYGLIGHDPATVRHWTQ